MAKNTTIIHPALIKTHIVLLCSICLSFLGLTACSAQSSRPNEVLEGKWYVTLTHQDIGQARTVLEFNTQSNTFTAHSRKNADKDILGRWTSFLGRTFTKNLKNGSLLNIDKGIYEASSDTLHLAGILITPMGHFNLEGHIVGTILHATLRNKSRGQLGTLSGNRDIPILPLENYAQLFETAVSVTETKIFNKTMLQSQKWQSFIKEVRSCTPRLQDDLEMVLAFFYRAEALPFSHFSLMKPYNETGTDTSPVIQRHHLSLEEMSPQTAYLKIASFSGKAQEVDSIFGLIIQRGYRDLIVDLRNNPGGSVEAGMAFATNVMDKETFGGVFLTQKWFNDHQTLPTPEAYKELPHFTASNTGLIIQGIHQTKGLCLKIIPKKEVYKGRLYVLTNRQTASTCEPIVYALKQHNRAVIIGEKTAGAMLNGEMFDVGSGFKIIIPTADYYASDGFKIDQNGVTPDVQRTSEEALNTAIQLIDN